VPADFWPLKRQTPTRYWSLDVLAAFVLLATFPRKAKLRIFKILKCSDFGVFQQSKLRGKTVKIVRLVFGGQKYKFINFHM